MTYGEWMLVENWLTIHDNPSCQVLVNNPEQISSYSHLILDEARSVGICRQGDDPK